MLAIRHVILPARASKFITSWRIEIACNCNHVTTLWTWKRVVFGATKERTVTGSALWELAPHSPVAPDWEAALLLQDAGTYDHFPDKSDYGAIDLYRHFIDLYRRFIDLFVSKWGTRDRERQVINNRSLSAYWVVLHCCYSIRAFLSVN